MTKKEQQELSAYCKKECGLEAKEVADYAEVPRRTFYDWWNGRRRAVQLIVMGIKYDQKNK
jgi:predicted transcriptional regulator